MATPRNHSSVFNIPLGSRYTREEGLLHGGGSGGSSGAFSVAASHHLRSSSPAAVAAPLSLVASSLKQLSEVQGRQAGLVLGATVGGAALSALAGIAGGADAIAELIRDNDEAETALLRQAPAAATNNVSYRSYDPAENPDAFSVLDPLVFAEGTGKERGLEGTMGEHAFRLRDSYLQAVHEHRHAVALSKVAPLWSGLGSPVGVGTACASTPVDYVAAALVATAVNYPYASDDALRRYNRPFLEVLLAQREEGQPDAGAAAFDAEAALVDAFLSVPLRLLQSNPDAVRNAAFNSPPGAGLVFPAEYLRCVPPLPISSVPQKSPSLPPFLTQSSASPHPHYEYADDAAIHGTANTNVIGVDVLRTAVAVVHRSRSFSEGVLLASRAATHALCPGPAVELRAGNAKYPRRLPPGRLPILGSLVGACLGAKFGARAIPLEWLAALNNGGNDANILSAAAARAIEVAQWSWNTPARLGTRGL